jgi:catabolite repression protein CreC
MENESTFVAPEGVYSLTDEHKPLPATLGGQSIYPTKVSSVVVRFTATKQGGPPGLAQLLGGNKDQKKANLTTPKEREDGVSLSSSDTPDESEQPPSSTQDHPPPSPSIPHEPHTLFSHSTSKKKNAARPKHNIRTTSSSFITRIQTAEGLSKTLQSKQGDATFLFYNQAKSYVWVEAGSKVKAGPYPVRLCPTLTDPDVH